MCGNVSHPLSSISTRSKLCRPRRQTRSNLQLPAILWPPTSPIPLLRQDRHFLRRTLRRQVVHGYANWRVKESQWERARKNAKPPHPAVIPMHSFKPWISSCWTPQPSDAVAGVSFFFKHLFEVNPALAQTMYDQYTGDANVATSDVEAPVHGNMPAPIGVVNALSKGRKSQPPLKPISHVHCTSRPRRHWAFPTAHGKDGALDSIRFCQS